MHGGEESRRVAGPSTGQNLAHSRYLKPEWRPMS